MKNELRLGNYVLANGKIERMHCISEEYPFLDTDYYGVGTIDWKDIKPIELTKEWFLNFGFKFLDGSGRWVIGNLEKNAGYDLAILYTYSGKFVFYHCTELKYVHQLQNLYFALNGKDLIYKEIKKISSYPEKIALENDMVELPETIEFNRIKFQNQNKINHCARCGIVIPADKWYLCEDCDKLQP